MKTYKFFLLFLIPLLSICGNTFASEKKGGPPPAKVAVEKVQARNIQSTSKLVGKVNSLKTSQVGAEAAGLVKKVKVEEGNIVKKNQLLVILANSQLTIAIQGAKAAMNEEKAKLLLLENGKRPAELNKAKAEMEEAEILWKKQKQELKRVERLFKKDLLSENEYMNSLLESDAMGKSFLQKKEDYSLLKEGTRKEEIAMQTARVEMKKSQLDFLLDRKKKTKIVAPFDGVVIKKFVEEGEWINQGTPVVKIIQINPIRIDVLVPEDAIYTLNKEDDVSIEVDAIPGKLFNGKISQIIPEASESSRTFPVRIILPNPDYILKSGMTARALISYGELKKAIIVPQDALIISGNNTFVYTLGQDNKAQMVPVKPGRYIKGWIELTGNLDESDMVIVKGNERLRPGQTVVVTGTN